MKRKKSIKPVRVTVRQQRLGRQYKKNKTPKQALQTTYKLNPFSLLLYVFLVLKITGVVSWSWWWVLSPILFPLGLLWIGIILVYVGGDRDVINKVNNMIDSSFGRVKK